MNDNERIQFKCKDSNKYVKPDRTVHEGFMDWAYICAQWSDFGDNVPSLGQNIFPRKETLPKICDEKNIYNDDNNIRHLIVMSYFNFHREIMYSGNMLENEHMRKV